MLKIAALAMGLITVVTIAPSAESTNLQTEREARHQGGRTRSDVNGQLHAERLTPIEKSVKLWPKLLPKVIKPTSAKVPTDRKPELPLANREPQPIKSQSQRELEDRSWLRPNERPISIWDNSRAGSSLNGFGNFHNVNR